MAIRSVVPTSERAGLLEAIADTLDDLIVVVDADGTIVLANVAWERASGSVAGCGPGSNYLVACRDVSGPDADAIESLRALLSGRGGAFEHLYPCQAPDGPVRWFRLIARPMAVAGGRGALLLHRDVSDEMLHRGTLADAAAAGARRDTRTQELAALGALPADALPVSAALSGNEPLAAVAPREVDEAVRRYRALLDAAVEQRTYLGAAQPDGPLRELAALLGALRAGPRDVTGIHLRVMAALVEGKESAALDLYAEEARLLLVRVMGYLLAYYRAGALQRPAPPNPS